MDGDVNYPHGMIPRVEAHKHHRRFVSEVRPSVAMLKLMDARRLVGRGETAGSYFGPETTVIVSSTQNDASLAENRWTDEFDVLRRFKPDYCIPADYPCYEDDPREVRMENVKDCMRGTVYLREKIADTPGLNTRVVPLIKGMSPRERRVCYSVFREYEWEYAAVYGTQYFTGGQGGRVWELANDVESIVDETNGELDLLLIGSLATFTLSKMPSEVVAAAGMYRWRTAVEPRTNDPSSMRREYDRVADEVEAVLADERSDPVRPQASGDEKPTPRSEGAENEQVIE